MYTLIISVIVVIATLSLLSEIIVADGDVTAHVIIVYDQICGEKRDLDRYREKEKHREGREKRDTQTRIQSEADRQRGREIESMRRIEQNLDLSIDVH